MSPSNFLACAFLSAAVVLAACGQGKQPNGAAPSAPSPPPPPPRPLFLPASAFPFLSSNADVVPTDFEPIDVKKFFDYFEPDHVEEAVKKKPYETEAEYKAREQSSFSQAISPVELGIDYPFDVSVLWTYDAERELLTLGLAYKDDYDAEWDSGIGSSLWSKIRWFNVGFSEYVGVDGAEIPSQAQFAVPRNSAILGNFEIRYMDGSLGSMTYSFSVPLSRDMARVFLKDGNRDPFKAIFVASVDPELPCLGYAYSKRLGGRIFNYHTIFGKLSKLVFYSTETREVIKVFSSE